MTDKTCGIEGCGRPAPDGTICWHHTWLLERDLRGIPALLTDLNDTLARQTKTTAMTEKVKGKGETALDYNAAASEALLGLLGALTGWARDYGMAWAEYATTSAAHLLDVLPDSRTRADLPALYDEISDACHRGRNAIDPQRTTVFPVGPCPEDHCTNRVFAFLPSDDTRPARMACYPLTTDKRPDRTNPPPHVYETHQWLRASRRILDRIEQQRRRQASA